MFDRGPQQDTEATGNVRTDGIELESRNDRLRPHPTSGHCEVIGPEPDEALVEAVRRDYGGCYSGELVLSKPLLHFSQCSLTRFGSAATGSRKLEIGVSGKGRSAPGQAARAARGPRSLPLDAGEYCSAPAAASPGRNP